MAAMPVDDPTNTIRSKGFGRPDWCRCVLIEVASAVLWETAAARRALHRLTGAWGSCDVRLVVAGRDLLCGPRLLPPAVHGRRPCPDCGRDCEREPTIEQSTSTSFRLSGHCECSGLLADVLDCALRYLDLNRATILDPPAAARRHVKHRQHDYIRTRRAARGAQVRTDRLETSAQGRRLATQEQRWLLRDIADEAGSEAPLDSEEALFNRLAVLRARRTGEDPSAVQAAVEVDFQIVRAACSVGRLINVGNAIHPEYVSWWDAYVERPLGRRRRSSDISLDNYSIESTLPRESERFPGLCAPEPDLAVGTLRAFLLDALRHAERQHSGRPTAEVLWAALEQLANAYPMHRATILEFLADQERGAMALAAVAELLHSTSGSARATA
jgi:hypothetical protein